MIDIHDLSFTYSDGNQVLKRIEIKIEEGCSVALIGANGAGKSTLLSLMVGINEPKDGRIELCNLAVCRKNLDKIRQTVGFVFQNPDDQLFMARVYDDIAFGPRNFGFDERESKLYIESVIHDFKIEHLIDRPPHKLSGGEKRIVAIAAVLAMKPRILLLDEPTSYLDPRSKRNTVQILKNLKMTKLISTHDLDIVSDCCQRVLVLKDGRIFADGKPDEILSDHALLEEAGL